MKSPDGKLDVTKGRDGGLARARLRPHEKIGEMLQAKRRERLGKAVAHARNHDEFRARNACRNVLRRRDRKQRIAVAVKDQRRATHGAARFFRSRVPLTDFGRISANVGIKASLAIARLLTGKLPRCVYRPRPRRLRHGRACAAEPLTPDGHLYGKLSDSDILQAWSLAHRACIKHTPGACDEADEIDREMPPRGFCYMDDGADARWTKCNDKAVAAAPALAPPQEVAPAAPRQEAASPASPHEAERRSPSPREAALCEAMRYAMFTSPQAAARASALCDEIVPAGERWARDSDQRSVLIIPNHGRWARAPTGPEDWVWVYPRRQWRLDPADRWSPFDR